jgi:[ribosomal protein S5]-alanine N-acetyltransferase
MLGLLTQRLHLVAGTLDHAEAEVHERARLSQLLNALVPQGWPPPLNDEASMKWFLRYLQENPDANGWAMWYFLLPVGFDGPSIVIGNGGFKGKPSVDRTVEVGYSIMEEHQCNGYCTEAVRALVCWAFEHSEVKRVIAETPPHLSPSIRVLEKTGFTLVGKGAEEGTIRYALTREHYEAQSFNQIIPRSENLS